MSSPSYLIVTFEPIIMASDDFVKPSFLIDKAEFSKGFKNKWPQGMLRKSREPIYSWVLENGEQKLTKTSKTAEDLMWSLPPESDNQFLSGFVEDYVVSLNLFPRKSFADFILWYRQFISDRISLYLASSGYLDKALELTGNTSREDIFRFVGFSTIED